MTLRSRSTTWAWSTSQSCRLPAVEWLGNANGGTKVRSRQRPFVPPFACSSSLIRPTSLIRLARLLSALWITRERPKANRARRTQPFEGNTLGKIPRDGQKTERCTDTTQIGAESGSRCDEANLERRICRATAEGYPIEPSCSCASLPFSATSTADTPKAPHPPRDNANAAPPHSPKHASASGAAKPFRNL